MGASRDVLWAALPLIAIAGVEQIVFHTWHFARLVGSRLIGNTMAAGDMFPSGPVTHITPGIFLTSRVCGLALLLPRLSSLQGPAPPLSGPI